MLKSNKIEKTPEDKKKARAKRIQDHAKEIIPLMLASVYPAIRKDLEVAISTQNIEMARSIKSQAFDGVCHSCIDLAISWEKTWKKRKGEFMAD